MTSRFPILLLCCTLVCCKAREQPRKVPAEQSVPAGLKAYVLDEPPPISHPLDVAYGDNVELLGYDIAPSGAIPRDQDVTLKLYWRLKEKPRGNWKLSTHVVDAGGRKVLDLYNASPIRAGRRGHPRFRPSAWSLGKVYVDNLSFKLPADLTSRKVKVLAGVYSTNTRRMPVSRGKADESHRALVTTLDVAIENPTAASTKLARDVKLEIDGQLDEPAWSTAPVLGPLLHVRATDASGTERKKKRPAAREDAGSADKLAPGATPAGARSTARLLWNDHALYLGYRVQDADVRGGFEEGKRDAELWTSDAVAVIVDPDGDGKGDCEIQINPQNLVFDAEMVERVPEGSENGSRTPRTEWTSRVVSRVTVDGTLDKSEVRDGGYVVEAMIPWSSLAKLERRAPKLGSSFKVNVYAIDQGSAVGWSPTFEKEDFRSAGRFGTVRFVGTSSAGGAAPL